MARLLIYREDLKVILIKQNGKWILPNLSFTSQTKLKHQIKELLGFSIETSGKKHAGTILARRVFGGIKDNVRWVDLEEASQVFEKSSSELKKWVNDDIAFSTKKQLDSIEEVFNKFDTENLEIYLCGGWAIDFLVGRVLRPHVDIDTFVWKKDKEKVRRVMKQLGFSVKDKERKFQNSRDGFQFDNDFVEALNDSFVSGRTARRKGIKWPKETFKELEETKLNSVHVKVIDPRVLYSFLKTKLEYNLKIGGSSGPVGKTKQDLTELKRYLEK